MSAHDDKKHMSRRAWFSRMFAPLKPAKTIVAAQAGAQVAVISGRSCLVYQGMECTACSDHCPVPGAIVIEDGYPMVVPEVCTGCRACLDVCPATGDAILMVTRRQ